MCLRIPKIYSLGVAKKKKIITRDEIMSLKFGRMKERFMERFAYSLRKNPTVNNRLEYK